MRLRARLRDEIDGGNLHKRLPPGVAGQQRLDFATQVIVVTGLGKIRRALAGRPAPRGFEECFDLSLSVGAHDEWVLLISRDNQALAKFQSRTTVIGESFSASAVSSTVIRSASAHSF
jgi:hypothetical protein